MLTKIDKLENFTKIKIFEKNRTENDIVKNFDQNRDFCKC